MKRLLITAMMITCMLTQHASAIPMAPMASMTIVGTIETISWVSEKSVKGTTGISGSAGSDRTVPAHYSVTLKDTKVTSDGNGYAPFESGKPIVITLDHPEDDNFLKAEMKVKIIDFTMGGDEGGVRTRFKEIVILDGKK